MGSGGCWNEGGHRFHDVQCVRVTPVFHWEGIGLRLDYIWDV